MVVDYYFLFSIILEKIDDLLNHLPPLLQSVTIESLSGELFIVIFMDAQGG